MSDITKYYVDQASGIFHGPAIQNGYGQRGNGLGKLLKNFMSWITPLAKKHIVPRLESGAKTVGKNLVDAVSDFAKDTIEGKDVKDAANERYHEVVNVLKQKAEDKFEGKGLKRKKATINKTSKNKSYVILKKRNKRDKDIFDNI